jgi:hypothetical protein
VWRGLDEQSAVGPALDADRGKEAPDIAAHADMLFFMRRSRIHDAIVLVILLVTVPSGAAVAAPSPGDTDDLNHGPVPLPSTSTRATSATPLSIATTVPILRKHGRALNRRPRRRATATDRSSS